MTVQICALTASCISFREGGDHSLSWYGFDELTQLNVWSRDAPRNPTVVGHLKGSSSWWAVSSQVLPLPAQWLLDSQGHQV